VEIRLRFCGDIEILGLSYQLHKNIGEGSQNKYQNEGKVPFLSSL